MESPSALRTVAKAGLARFFFGLRTDGEDRHVAPRVVRRASARTPLALVASTRLHAVERKSPGHRESAPLSSGATIGFVSAVLQKRGDPGRIFFRPRDENTQSEIEPVLARADGCFTRLAPGAFGFARALTVSGI